MSPLYNLPELEIKVVGYTPNAILQKINTRLEKLLGKDHLIGHSYFIDINGDIKRLLLAFQNKIIPLLQEYFYGDAGKIGLVLGKAFFEEDDEKSNSIFADFDYDSSGLAERRVYHFINLSDESKMNDDKFAAAIAILMK